MTTEEMQEEIDTLNRQQEFLRKTLNKLFGWRNDSWLHALSHIENAVLNLRTDLKVERKLREMAESERDEARRAVQLLWEEGHDPSRCNGELGGRYYHHFSEPCRNLANQHLDEK